MTHLCVTCPTLFPSRKPRHYDRAQCCESCRQRMRTDLGQLPDAFALLPAALEPGRGYGGPRVSGSPSRSLGVVLGVLNLLSPAGVSGPIHDEHGDQTGVLPPLVVLDQWARDWRDVLFPTQHRPVPTMSSLTGWLLNRLDDACDRHPAIDDFAAELSRIVGTVIAVAVQDRRGEHVGYCPAVHRDGSYCGTRLEVDPYLDYITCPHRECGTSWDKRRGGWVTLAAAQLAMEAAAKEMSA